MMMRPAGKAARVVDTVKPLRARGTKMVRQAIFLHPLTFCCTRIASASLFKTPTGGRGRCSESGIVLHPPCFTVPIQNAYGRESGGLQQNDSLVATRSDGRAPSSW